MRNIFILSLVLTVFIGCSKQNNADEIALDSLQKFQKYSGQTGSLSGVVSLAEAGVLRDRFPIERDQAVCGATHINTALPGTGGGVRGCVIWLDGVTTVTASSPLDTVVMDQVSCTFTPHIVQTRPGAPIRIHNSDATLHNFHVIGNEGSVINEVQPEGAPPREIRIRKPGIYRVICDVHPWMRGFISIKAHPYFVLTDESGEFTINDIPPGTYTLKLWRDSWDISEMRAENGKIAAYKWGDDFKREQTVTIEAGRSTQVSFTLP